MSRVGRRPIDLPAGATATVEGRQVTVNGPRGELSHELPAGIELAQEGAILRVERGSDAKSDRSLHGLTRTLVYNMVRGVTEGYEKALEIQGVGYRAILKGRNLELALGYSSPRLFVPPDGIEFEVPVPTRITVKGCDKQKVGQVAADIRSMRKPDPYKGKGIRYRDEQIRRKAGKAVK